MEDDGDESPYVKLISAEQSEIFLPRRIALQEVETLRAMLEGNFRESEEGVIRFPDMSASALEKVVKYLHYKDRYSNCAARIPEFAIEPEEVSVLVKLVLHAFLTPSHYHVNFKSIGLGVISCSKLSELLGSARLRFIGWWNHSSSANASKSEKNQSLTWSKIMI
ncbi:hypothetical protein ACHAWF_000764 [Thalassiosira exigua]